MGKQPILTFVTVGELAQWTKLRHWGPRNLAMLDSWLADKPVIPGSKAVAAIQRGRPRPVNDTWVAACCLAYQLPLATLNAIQVGRVNQLVILKETSEWSASLCMYDFPIYDKLVM